MKKLTILAVASLFLLSGCFQQPGLVQDRSYDRTKAGAVIGAIAGAVIGYNTKGHHKNRRAAIGALAGALAGSGAGYLLDKQANEVARALGTGVDNDPLAALDPNRDIIVSKFKNYVKIMLRDKMMFRSGSAVLTSSAQMKVAKIKEVLRRYPQTNVGVAGFTDNKGSYQMNLKLSAQRANSVAQTLTLSKYPRTKGCSYNKAIAPNDTEANRALNRRVEIYLFGDNYYLPDPCSN